MRARGLPTITKRTKNLCIKLEYSAHCEGGGRSNSLGPETAGQRCAGTILSMGTTAELHSVPPKNGTPERHEATK
jgi:hypothetical protein